MMNYKKGFTQFETMGYGKVKVTNAGWYICKFDIGPNYATISQEDFNKQCEEILSRSDLTTALKGSL
jgi:hypothetical protein